MALAFLTARWANLINLTYRVPPEVLAPHVPPGTTLDVHDGTAFASLVAFDFLDTRVFGIPWPGFRDFPELNLRFYLKKGNQRGVAFIREYVPQRLVAGMARLVYNEPYVAAPIRSKTQRRDSLLSYELSVDVGGRTHTVRMSATLEPWTPPEDSLAHYFKEHRWGFGVGRSGRTLTYEVDHPVWAIHDVQSWSLDADFELLYGPEWAFLGDAEPFCALLAEGSQVRVMPRGDLADVDAEPMDHILPDELAAP